jgi:hypothetical protein
MAVLSATREAPAVAPHANSPHRTPHSSNALRAAETRSAEATRQLGSRPMRHLTDDEILDLSDSVESDPAISFDASLGASLRPTSGEPASEVDESLNPSNASDSQAAADPSVEQAQLRAALDANPELRRAWDDAQAYRESFTSPDEARTATALLSDLDRMDALFFSRRPEDHAELARAVASLDPAAFVSLAQAMAGLASTAGAQNHPGAGPRPVPATTPASSTVAPTPAQADFFHSTNAAAVQGIVDSIESQVERLLPEGVSKSARNRVVGEIYRELDITLRSNRQLTQQMRDAFRSGPLDADHQRAVVSLVTGRARQALPGVAKRVLSEWTSTIVAANQDRRTRQHAAEQRVDIAGSSGTGNDGPRSVTPREIDYRRMSDSDILNL